MTARERLYAWLNNATFTEENGCRHPQELIAQAIGCDKRTVIRCIKDLETEGRLRVDRPRKRGMCNTYYVSCWNPMRRSGVLNVLRAIREDKARRGQCHPKRTAKPSRAPTTSFLLRCGVENQRGWSRARARIECKDGRVQRELECAGCAQRNEIIRTLETNMVVLTEQKEHELAGLEETVRSTGAKLSQARRELSRVREEEPESADIRAIFEHWRKGTGHLRTKLKAGDGRWEIIRKALRYHSKADLCEALDGLALLPYVGAKGRKAVGEERERNDRIGIPLGDVEAVDRFRGYALRAGEAVRNGGLEGVHATYLQVAALEREWGGLFWGEYARRELEAASTRTRPLQEEDHG